MEAELAARRRLLSFASLSLEDVIRARGPFLTERVTERLRLSCLEQPQQVQLEALLEPLLELGLEDARAAVADKTAAAPALRLEAGPEGAGRADVAAHLLRYAVAELAKNSCAAAGEAECVLRVAVSTPHALILRLENPGTLLERLEWFVSGGEEAAAAASGYAYGGAHGAPLRGLGAGLQTARCALAAFGASAALGQRAPGLVAADIVLLRRQPRAVV